MRYIKHICIALAIIISSNIAFTSFAKAQELNTTKSTINNTAVTPYVVVFPTDKTVNLFELTLRVIIFLTAVVTTAPELAQLYQDHKDKGAGEKNAPSVPYDYVKAYGSTTSFDPKLTSNYCGPSQTNNFTRVKELQATLNHRVTGLNLTVDGYWGPATLNAVKSFQSANSLSSDGIVGPTTWRILCTDNK